MSINIQRDLAPRRPGQNCFAGHNNGRKWITVHQTGNPRAGASARMHANLQISGFTASWHYSVDSRDIIQSFEHSTQCYHAGDGQGNGNMNSIAIELCVNSDDNYNGAIENGAKLVAHLMKAENVPLSKVVQHNHWSGKNCPMEIRAGKNGITWSRFKDKVTGYLDGGVGSSDFVMTYPNTSQGNYLKKIEKGAVASYHKYKILPSVIMAQAPLESGWGTSSLAAKYNNHFGIKDSNDWTGRTVTLPTQEWNGHSMITVQGRFRVYDDYQKSIEDHGAFFTSTEWRKNNYRHVVGERDYKEALRQLQLSGYATDPNYSSKLLNIIETYNLHRIDRAVFDGYGLPNRNTGNAPATPSPPVPSAPEQYERIDSKHLDYKGAQIKKLKGEDVLVNEEINDKFSWKLRGQRERKWIEHYEEFEAENPEELLEKAVEFMEDRSTPKISYTLRADKLPTGIQAGDRGFIILHEFNPPLYVEATISKITQDLFNPQDKPTVEITNVEEVEPQDKTALYELQAELIKQREELRREMFEAKVTRTEITSDNGLLLSSKGFTSIENYLANSRRAVQDTEPILLKEKLDDRAGYMLAGRVVDNEEVEVINPAYEEIEDTYSHEVSLVQEPIIYDDLEYSYKQTPYDDEKPETKITEPIRLDYLDVVYNNAFDVVRAEENIFVDDYASILFAENTGAEVAGNDITYSVDNTQVTSELIPVPAGVSQVEVSGMTNESAHFAIHRFDENKKLNNSLLIQDASYLRLTLGKGEEYRIEFLEGEVARYHYEGVPDEFLGELYEPDRFEELATVEVVNDVRYKEIYIDELGEVTPDKNDAVAIQYEISVDDDIEVALTPPDKRAVYTTFDDVGNQFKWEDDRRINNVGDVVTDTNRMLSFFVEVSGYDTARINLTNDDGEIDFDAGGRLSATFNWYDDEFNFISQDQGDIPRNYPTGDPEAELIFDVPEDAVFLRVVKHKQAECEISFRNRTDSPQGIMTAMQETTRVRDNDEIEVVFNYYDGTPTDNETVALLTDNTFSLPLKSTAVESINFHLDKPKALENLQLYNPQQNSDRATATTLRVIVWEDEIDVTRQYRTFVWTRISDSTADDLRWNDELRSTGSSLRVRATDLYDGEATFICKIYDDSDEFVTSVGATVKIDEDTLHIFDEVGKEPEWVYSQNRAIETVASFTGDYEIRPNEESWLIDTDITLSFMVEPVASTNRTDRLIIDGVIYEDFSDLADANNDYRVELTFTLRKKDSIVKLNSNKPLSIYDVQLEYSATASDFVEPSMSVSAGSGIAGKLYNKADREDLENVIQEIETDREYVRGLRTDLEVTKDGAFVKHTAEYVSTIEKIIGDVENVDEQITILGEVAELIDTYFEFADGFTIGKSNSKNKIFIDNEELQFLDGNTIMAYLRGTLFATQNISISGSLEIGGRWVLSADDNGLLVLDVIKE